MCGITGCLGLAAGERPDSQFVRVAAERISHRGPDDEGFFADGQIALGVKRLAIIELSVAGHRLPDALWRRALLHGIQRRELQLCRDW
jgi:asparagine synthase (glutamine-hydrolysing)